MMLDLRSIATALGGEVQGRQVVAPAPGHSRRDRSLSVRLSPQSPAGFVVHTFSGHDFREARDYVAEKLGLPLDTWRTRGRDEFNPSPATAGPDPDRERRALRAATLWAEAADARGTVVERYLGSRGLELPPGADALRFHPRCPWREEAAGRTIFVPAMVAALRAIEGDAITGVHRTRLTPEGAKVDRRMLGQASGAAVKLDGDDALTLGLHLAEGIETALAGRQLGLRPAWAVGSAGAIATFPVLDGIETLTLLAEHDDANRRAVDACARRWHAAGREVIVVEPTIGNDLNDAIRGAA